VITYSLIGKGNQSSWFCVGFDWSCKLSSISKGMLLLCCLFFKW